MTSEHTATTLPDSPRLLTRVRDKIHLKHYSIRTEHAYVDWIRRFTRFHGKRHPTDLGPMEVESFLTDLAVAHGERCVDAEPSEERYPFSRACGSSSRI